MIWSDSGGGSSYEAPPSGTHFAYCISIIDIGLQKSNSPQFKDAHKVVIVWELPDEQKADGTPHTISEFYRMSLNEKANLRRMVDTWRGKALTEDQAQAFNPMVLLGVPCMLSVSEHTKENGDKTGKVSSVAPVPKRITQGGNLPPMTHQKTFFSLQDYDAQVFGGLSEGMQKLIMKSETWQQLGVRAPLPRVESQPRSAQPQPMTQMPYSRQPPAVPPTREADEWELDLVDDNGVPF